MNKINSKIKGAEKEQIVSQYLIKRGWEIVCQNKKILGVELDILAQKNKDRVLIEVKSVSKSEQIERILKPNQKERLKQAAESLCDDSQHSIRFFLAVVDRKNKVDFFEIN